MPFLKKGTIQRRVSLFEPWYGQWPKFYEKAYHAYKKRGYKFLTITDISAYYENIDISILREMIKKYFPKEHKIINLLCDILEYWTWPTKSGHMIPRGIPQADDVCNFLGNIYLLPLDEEINTFSKRREIEYFRYLDDIKIFSRERAVALESLFLMNDVLRSLHLNIQGSKTAIREGAEIEKDIYDQRLDNVNKIIKEIQNIRALPPSQKNKFVAGLKKEYRNIPKRNKLISEQNLRLYKRLITGFMLLRSPYILNNVLRQVYIIPDRRLLGNAINYFKSLERSGDKISKHVLYFLTSSGNLFAYQEAHLISALRKLRTIHAGAVNYARQCLRSKQKHWYVRVESALLLASLNLRPVTLKALYKLFDGESDIEVKRALVKCLCQAEKQVQAKLINDLVFDNNPKLSSLGRMLASFAQNQKHSAQNEISRLFREFDRNSPFNESVLLEEYYKIDVIKQCENQAIYAKLLTNLKRAKRKVKRKHLKDRIISTIKLIETNSQRMKTAARGSQRPDGMASPKGRDAFAT